MANMTYCRFQNTLADLGDCERAMCDGAANDADLSEEELKARQRLIRLCFEIVKDYGPDAVSNVLFTVPREAWPKGWKRP